MMHGYDDDGRGEHEASQQAEWEARQEHEAQIDDRARAEAEAAQEPDAVPCFKCNLAMYQVEPKPEGNVCDNCRSTFPIPA